MTTRFFLCISFFINLLLIANDKQPKSIWTATNVFEPKVFIENKGQYDLRDEGLHDEVVFSANQDGLQYYFTKNAIWIKHISSKKRTEKEIEQLKEKLGIKEKKGETEENEFKYKLVNQFHVVEFIGAGANTEIQSEDLVSQLYNFGTSKNTTISARAYKKIIYKNLYDGIDMEFYFPEDKQGFKYNFILKQGAQPNQIKIRFPESKKIKIDEEGNLIVKSIFGDFTDHAPIANEAASGKIINCAYKIKNGIVTFNFTDFKKEQGLIIDPWTTTPNFSSGSHKAYDVDWDNFGNCYVYGGPINSYQVIKLNSTGMALWSFTPPISFSLYGDFAVDRRTGSVYIIEAYNNSMPVKVIKTNSNGVQVSMFAGNQGIDEMWRIAFNPCLNLIVIAGGGDGSPYYTGCTLDTNLTNFTGKNILNIMAPWHDMWGLALDNFGNAYMGSALSLSGSSQFQNYLFKVPLPSLAPNAFSVPLYYHFHEAGSEIYNQVFYNSEYANGYNGIAASNSNLYTYDTYVLKKWNSNNGTIIDSLIVNGTSQGTMSWGGITADNCNHLF